MSPIHRKMLVWCFLCSFLLCFSGAEETEATGKSTPTNTSMSIGRQLVEEGRTLVHHAVKRFMIILPAIFFKLGAAFTLLILVTIAVVTNGFIGFLLLVVGLSSVLARLQHTDRPNVVSVPYIGHAGHGHGHYASYSPYYGAAWKRSDNAAATTEGAALAYNYADQLYKPSLGYTYSAYSPTN